MFGTFKLTRNANKSLFNYNGQGIAFDGRGTWRGKRYMTLTLLEMLHYYLFPFVLQVTVLLMASWYSEWCVPNKTEDLNLHAFNMITGIN